MAYMDPDDPRAKSAFLEFVFMQNEPYLTKGIFQHRYLTFPGTAWLGVIGPGGVFCFGRCHGFRLRLNPLTAAMAAVTSLTPQVPSDPVNL